MKIKDRSLNLGFKKGKLGSLKKLIELTAVLDLEILAKNPNLLEIDLTFNELNNQFQKNCYNKYRKRERQEIAASSQFREEKRSKTVAHFQTKYGIKYPTESDAENFIMTQKNSSLTKGNITVVNAPKKDYHSRPDTFSTITELLKQHETELADNVIAISNQPYILGQSLPLKLLPDRINCHLIGQEANQEKPELLEIILSEFAAALNKSQKLEVEKEKRKPASKLRSSVCNAASKTSEQGR